MANISDIIEEFILANIGADAMIELSRRELADYFSCAPSQINYVLSTRFTQERGYAVEGKRGGGGCIKVYRLTTDDMLDSISKMIGDRLSVAQANYVLENLQRAGYIREDARLLLATSISDRALAQAGVNAPVVRADIIKQLLLRLSR